MEDPNASTGSSWFGNLTDNLGSLLKSAPDVITAIKGTPKPTVKPATTGTIGGFPMQTFLLIGAGLLTVVLLVFMFKRHK